MNKEHYNELILLSEEIHNLTNEKLKAYFEKLNEEDPLIIGYITRKGSAVSKYGEAYLNALSEYREIQDTDAEH